MSSLNHEADRRMQAVFDEAVELSREDQGLFFSGFFGRVQARVMLGSALDDDFVSGVEDLLAQVKKMSTPK